MDVRTHVETDKRYQEREHFRDRVRVLLRETISDTYLVNCQSIADLIAAETSWIPVAALIALDRNENIWLKSLSYTISEGFARSLEGYTDKYSKFISSSGSKNTKTVVLKRQYTIIALHFRSNVTIKHIRSILSDIADMYNYMVINSHNFRNHVYARVYNFAKPQGSGYYPKFNSIVEVCRELSHRYHVRAEHFIYVGPWEREYEKHDIDLQFLTYKRKRVSQFFGLDRLPPILVKSLSDVVISRQSRVGHLLLESGKKIYYCIFPVYDPNIRQYKIPADGALVILSRRPHNIFLMKSSEEWLISFSSKQHVQRSNILALCIKTAEEEIKNSEMNATQLTRNMVFKKISQMLCEMLCSWTHAASVTVRRIDRLEEKLERVASFQSLWGSYDEGSLRDDPTQTISLKLQSSSFNAFAANFNGNEKVLYISDTSNIPKMYSESGLHSILKRHPLTRTEAVIRILAGKAVVALLNIEAPVAGCLQHQLQFFEECGDFLGKLYARLWSLSDRDGLATVAKSHIELHSVADMLRTWKEKDINKAVEIVRRLQSRTFPNKEKEEAIFELEELTFPKGGVIGNNINNFNDGMYKWVEWALQSGAFEERAELIIKGKLPTDFELSLLPAAFVIISSIIENILGKPKIVKQELRIYVFPIGNVGTKTLVVEWISKIPMSNDFDHGDLLITPVVDRKGHRHFGFFLIGVYARDVGGVAEFRDIVSDKEIPTGFKVRVSIPYRPNVETVQKSEGPT